MPHIEPGWLAWAGGTVRKLALAAYQGRFLPGAELDLAALPVLSDALEETGCADVALLGPLRNPGPHRRGCHALDALLDKS